MTGRTISHYKILEKLGAGGMGVVYKAEDTKLKRTVALKFLPPHLTKDEEANARFITEAQAASALDHQNICTIFDIKETDDEQLFIVMAYYDGETLRQKIGGAKHSSKNSVTSLNQFAKNASPLPIDNVIDISSQIAAGLTRAHEAGITHRDIKPSNIMITERGEVKILDFGIARIAGQRAITKTGSTLGTVAYMSPEQVRGEQTDHRTDIWSLGVVLYEMLTGQQPLQGEYDHAVMYSICNQPHAPVSALREDMSEHIEQVVDKALAKKADERYQSVDEIRHDLKSRLTLTGFETLSELNATIFKPATTRKTRPAMFWPTLILVAVALAVVGYSFLGKGVDSPGRIPIAVADFVNETGEKELNGLSGLLITSLEQSRRLSVLTRSRMFDVLKQLGKEETEYIDEKLGLEICKQANVQALAIASIRKLGRRYAIDLKILDPQNDEYLFTWKEEGEGQENIFSMIDKIVEKTRIGLGEPAEAVQATRERIVDITTPNLEAYQHYFQGQQLIDKLKFKEAQEELRKAIELDSTFALAYERLAWAIAWGDGSTGEVRDKALQYIDRAPEKERYMIRLWEKDGTDEDFINPLLDLLELYPDHKQALFIVGDYSLHWRGDLTRATAYFEKVLAIDPASGEALDHLIWLNQETEQFGKVFEYAKQYVAQVPTEAAYRRLAEAYYLLDDFEGAMQTYNRALELESIRASLSL